MELLIITAVQSFENEVKKLLKANGVNAYSHVDVTGHKDLSDSSRNTNWFASDSGEDQSMLFYVFVEDEQVDKVLDDIVQLNSLQETASLVHAAVLNIKKSV